MRKPVRVLLVDDHTVVRSGLRLLVEQQADLQVVGEADCGAAGVAQALALRPDVVVMDLTLPDCDGVEATRRIRAAWAEARVLALTMHAEDTHLLPFVEAGGLGYVRKAAADEDVVTAIRLAAENKAFLHPEGWQTMVRGHQGTANSGQPGPEALSERERQVLELTARGFTSREIGEQLFLSPRTVETYRERLVQKLGLEHRSQLVEYALRYRLLG
ncbi:MAG: response regulator transcription factor [Anaerolineales bacterium]|nr:response regulator transcription factor [Anaerolineales bacterium]